MSIRKNGDQANDKNSELGLITKLRWSKQTGFATIETTQRSAFYSVKQYMPLQLSDVLKDRYRIEDILGQGGMGAVYRAQDLNLGVNVAVKENLFITDEYARQFRREANILASLRHPHLPRVTDHFVIDDEGQYLVMDFVKGEDLRDLLEKSDVIPEEQALPWFLEICDALAYLHTRTPPILHRDIKPGNIKITPDGNAILVDFGLAKLVDGGSNTTTGAKAMTPGFSPPEQYGTGSTDARTDVYSLAATLYAVLCGAIPEDALERAMGRENLTPPRKWNPKISSGIARAIEKALSIPPNDRYQSIAEFAGVLNAASLSDNTTLSRRLNYLVPSFRNTGLLESAPLRTQTEMISKRRRLFPMAALFLTTLFIALGFALTQTDIGLQLDAFLEPPTLIPPTNPIPSPEASSTISTESLPIFLPTDTLTTAENPIVTPTPSPSEEPTVTPTPAATAIGGGMGQLAFASIKDEPPQIYLMNIDGTGVTKLTDLPDGACQPAWSPDGTRLAITSPCLRSREQYAGSSIWLFSIDDVDPIQFPTIPGGGDFDPAWDPSGEKIAFTSIRDGYPQIYVINIDGTGLENITSKFAPQSQPIWDPRGTNLLVTGERDFQQEILIMDSEGNDELAFSIPGGQGHSNAHWSRDGQFVLYQRNLSGIPHLVTKRFEDRERFATQICPEGPRKILPMAEGRWSPDAQWIVFETWPDGISHNLGLMTASCTNYVELTDASTYDFDPAWRPQTSTTSAE